MFRLIRSAAHRGIDPVAIDVEVDVANGFPGFFIVGLPDTAIQEAKERIRTAWRHSGHKFPSTRRVLVNLAPADVRKEGTGFDLPIAVALFLAVMNIKPNLFTEALVIGELALDGTVRYTKGVLAFAIHAKKVGLKILYVPADNAAEAALIQGLDIRPIKKLSELFNSILLEKALPSYKRTDTHIQKKTTKNSRYDMAQVKGQEFAKRALEIAASGGHNILLTGPPGSGKTLLARTLPTILPQMTEEEVIDVTRIYSVSGLLTEDTPLISTRPFRSPHHSASGVALVGGGRIPRPGEISLAHRGVLFLDEFSEFPRPVLETLRQPLEDGVITISRAHGTLRFPAQFTLVASQNPCPCGYATDPEKNCSCSAMTIERYKKKISGPLLDRIDLHIEVPRIDIEKLTKLEDAESSTTIQKRVEAAKKKQISRFQDSQTHTNADMHQREVQQYCTLSAEGIILMKKASSLLQLSGRTYFRMLKVARTIADLAGSSSVETEHITEALQYRSQQ